MCAEAGPEGGDECSVQVRGARAKPTCPVCRQALARNPIRALAVEQTITALPAACRHCAGPSTRGAVLAHEAQCPRAPARCAAGADGCPWKGPAGEREAHEATCVWGRATGNTTEAIEPAPNCRMRTNLKATSKRCTSSNPQTMHPLSSERHHLSSTDMKADWLKRLCPPLQ
jgi:hypothetical protein